MHKLHIICIFFQVAYFFCIFCIRHSLGLWPGPGRRQLWTLSSQNVLRFFCGFSEAADDSHCNGCPLPPQKGHRRIAEHYAMTISTAASGPGRARGPSCHGDDTPRSRSGLPLAVLVTHSIVHGLWSCRESLSPGGPAVTGRAAARGAGAGGAQVPLSLGRRKYIFLWPPPEQNRKFVECAFPGSSACWAIPYFWLILSVLFLYGIALHLGLQFLRL